MGDDEIDVLKAAIAAGPVFWIDSETALRIIRVGEHAEEGPGHPCGLTDHGPYVALFGCELRQFYAARCLSQTTANTDEGKQS